MRARRLATPRRSYLLGLITVTLLAGVGGKLAYSRTAPAMGPTAVERRPAPVPAQVATSAAPMRAAAPRAVPPPPADELPAQPPAPPPIIYSALPLRLVSTTVSADPRQSRATIVGGRASGGYAVGDVLPGAGRITHVGYVFVEFANAAAGDRRERITLAGTAPSAPPAPAPAPARPATSTDPLSAKLDAGIKQTSDTTFEISRALVTDVLANPMAVAGGGRASPAMQDGKPIGLRLSGIKPTSAYAKLGLTSGDVLGAVNGFELSSADKVLELYGQLRNASQLELAITRRGKPLTLSYTIR